MKFALIGQDIPTLLPTLLTDLLFAGKEPADVWVHEGNPAMQEVLDKYGKATILRSKLPATITVAAERDQVLKDADCVIYAGDVQPASRFSMDRSALSSDNKDDPGLTDQARVNGGIGGLMHTLRAGEAVLSLCEEMHTQCPGALVINLGQPVARTTDLFLQEGFRCYGLGRNPMRGANGVDTLCKKMSRKADSVHAETAGLPGFAFLLEMTDIATGKDLLPQLKERAEKDELGRLARRWLDWYGALPVGDVTDHAEFLPAQPDYIPEEEPVFGETVEQRKERILHMNTIGTFGASSQDGAMAQTVLLSKAPPIRPVKLALAVLRKEDLDMPAVTRRNGKELPQLGGYAIIESRLILKGGVEQPHGWELPGELAEVCGEIAETNTLAAQAATGDRSALRECIDLDPALAGLDRLYCQDLVDKLIEMHKDVLPRL
jgi:alpha-galactosidase/6-phospho-beta-glucosidase family protein